MAITQTTDAPGGRTIFALMFFAIGFSLLGNEIKVAQAAKTPVAGTATGMTTSGRIILGGFFATTLLIMLSHAGNPGREWAVGLAGVTMVAAVFVEGKPVWDEFNKLFSSTPTTKTKAPVDGPPNPLATTTTHTTGTTVQTGATT